MIRKLFRGFKFKLAGGYLPIFVRRSVILGDKVTLIDRVDYELMMRELEWRWLRAFLLGVVFVVMCSVSAFVYGVRVGWVSEDTSFRIMCARVIRENFDSKKVIDFSLPDYEIASWIEVPKENFTMRPWNRRKKSAN